MSLALDQHPLVHDTVEPQCRQTSLASGSDWQLLGPPLDNAIGEPRPATARMIGPRRRWIELVFGPIADQRVALRFR